MAFFDAFLISTKAGVGDADKRGVIFAYGKDPLDQIRSAIARPFNENALIS
ncbi:hypothetical protein KDA_53660 [Dictyobacter alpinus]|uniref:Uncharacterized protein n=1 Tax=Dictyobacter alpinus TaxID=2014873 RepID=A0A402BF06_9CHLR|nr:hypothetical protein [Dictyobacter alpinus]GCE29882.1 hypothetical protein KDA_53660 [Dictyobacter alpinus]